MRLGHALILLAAAAPLPLLLIPSGSGACEICVPNETGEHWSLEIVEWSVEGSPLEVPSSDGGYFIENSITQRFVYNGQQYVIRYRRAGVTKVPRWFE